ncbi:hypothetical protein LOTGIDRAFT_227847 [Lottia gigantea]|uniref:Amino acid transporter transmembrane domain-containing protein n=1 Tax=Lottia gigantea TaxID=225164 RepID=V4ALV4_LOTGI|nr:hypothetical protein LOTGIDRAFT_227847 [Lottia gigantea]ESP05169.1 hypothetical protein LOTGIDRAFT_227847 [Lottia gigantea]
MGAGKSKDQDSLETEKLLGDQSYTSSRRSSISELSNPNERVIRQPIQYHSINNGGSESYDSQTRASVHRYRYYNRLAPHSNSILHMPNHVVPANYLIRIFSPVAGKQSSIITIFSLWNTMMGTSLLSMPWAIKQAGFITGIGLLIFVAGLMLYTSYRILRAVEVLRAENVDVLEFSDVCKFYFGKVGEITALVCSLMSLIGGMIVYWILMSNFIYHVVSFIYYHADGSFNSSTIENKSAYSDAMCPKANPLPDNNTNTYPDLLSVLGNFPIANPVFEEVWSETKTVPFFLLLVLAPIINFKSPTFFTKFNALGTCSVAYLFVFAAVKAAKWGIHIDFSSADQHLPDYTSNFGWTFPALTGIASLAYFIHNAVLSITANERNPKNSARDLTIAYVLVAITYIYMGAVFYSSFPLNKSCIEDNLLNNIETNDVMAFVARIGLFFQMVCVFPLLVFILRVQFMHSVFGSVWPSIKHVLILNVILLGICVVFAIFLPHIGRIIGFVGAFCGFSYAICLPCMVYIKSCYLNHGGLTLSWPKVVFHGFLIFLGIINFIAQFVIIGHTQ